MALSSPPLRAAGIALSCAALGACSLFGPAWTTRTPPPPPPVQLPPPPAEPPPVATFKFDVAADHDDLLGVVQLTKTTKEDTLTDIARRFNMGYEELVRANPGVDPWLPGADKEVVVPTEFILPDAPHQGVVINIAAMRLYYFPPHKSGEPQLVYTHPIGIGKVGWSTPEGTTKILRRQKDPTWRPPVSVIKEHKENGDDLATVVGPGPDNPLGRHAFYLAWPGYLIHGTNKPAGVGLRSSHGCIRLYPEDIARLYDMVPLGTTVTVVNQPFVFGWHDGQLYMQAYGSLEDDRREWQKAQKKLIAKSLSASVQRDLKRRNETVDWDLILKLAHDPRGVPVPVTQPGTGLEQVLASARKVENRLPEGASWDGKTDLPMDEKTFQQMFSEIDPSQHAAASPASHKTGT